MSDWLWIVAGAVVLGLIGGGLLGWQVASTQAPTPTIVADKTLSDLYTQYRGKLSSFNLVTRGIHYLPSPLTKKYPDQMLTEDKRMQQGSKVVMLREYYLSPEKGTYPLAVIFDVNGDGIFSLDEGYLLRGDPLYSAGTSLTVIAEGIQGGTDDRKEVQ